MTAGCVEVERRAVARRSVPPVPTRQGGVHVTRSGYGGQSHSPYSVIAERYHLERHRAGRRTSQPVLDLHINVRAGRTLYDRFMSIFARVMVGATKIIVGAVGGRLIVALVIWFVVTILTLPRP